MGRGLMIALAASLACNVFLGGFVAGRLLGKHPHPPPPERGMIEMRGMMGAPGILSEEGREVFAAVFIERRGELRESRRAVREARRAMTESLGKQPWDQAAVDQAIAAFHQAQDGHRTVQTDLFVEAYKKLSAEDRKALNEHQSRRRGRGGRLKDRAKRSG